MTTLQIYKQKDMIVKISSHIKNGLVTEHVASLKVRPGALPAGITMPLQSESASPSVNTNLDLRVPPYQSRNNLILQQSQIHV